VADEPQRLDPSDLFELMRDHDVTIWDTVPSVFRHAVETLSEITLARRAATLSHGLRLVVLTGEALNWALPAAWRKSIDHPAELINLYSHSETAGTVSMYPIPSATELGQGEVPLGWPVEGSTLYVLDSKRRLLPEGEAGELWVGGNRLADGYVGRPELTAKRFVTDPFRAGGHMYRTGDRGRLRADGAVEFVGRIDDRLNVRGHRIEPADVERALREHPAVSQALVSGKVDPRGDTRLVAYVVPVPMASPTVEGQLRYELPNHLAIAHVHKHETDFTYRAIYEDQTYLKHGITYADGDCIFDVGANIGLLSLFVHLMCARPRIYAFEPNPPASDALMANMRLYGVDSRVFPCGLSHEEGQGLFTTFEGFSLLSGLHADVEEEKKLVRAFMSNQANEELAAPFELEDQLEQVLEQHFVADNFEVPLRSLSSVIEDEEIERIDFLKINVEKSEWDVLRGIRREHWPLIHQVVIKVDLVDKLAAIVSLLESCGLDCVVDQDETMTGSRVHTVYAVRPSAARRLIREQSDGHHRRVLPPVTDSRLSRRDLREFLATRLPDHMTPSVCVLLESLPLNSNGKLNRAALPEPDWSHPDVERPYAPPACPIEQELGRIWCEVLGVARVGRHDHFLDLGGDSIKAVRMINRVRDHFHAPLPVTAPFRAPTVAGLAREILAKQNPGTEV
jgi:FkbM family methyltransferase